MTLLFGTDAREMWRWPHFSYGEFTSRGEHKVTAVDPDFMDKLERLRVAFERPMPITSGYRTPEHNQGVSTTGPNGPHTTGRAVDVAVRGSDAFDLVRLAILHGFTGIGVNQKGPSRFIHIDDLEDGGVDPPPRPTIWSY